MIFKNECPTKRKEVMDYRIKFDDNVDIVIIPTTAHNFGFATMNSDPDPGDKIKTFN